MFNLQLRSYTNLMKGKRVITRKRFTSITPWLVVTLILALVIVNLSIAEPTEAG